MQMVMYLPVNLYLKVASLASAMFPSFARLSSLMVLTYFETTKSTSRQWESMWLYTCTTDSEIQTWWMYGSFRVRTFMMKQETGYIKLHELPES